MTDRLKPGMYVRFANDEDQSNPRDFLCGQYQGMESISELAAIEIHDPFKSAYMFPHIRTGIVRIPARAATRCRLFDNTYVTYRNQRNKIIYSKLDQEGYYIYYLENTATKELSIVHESEVKASYENGKIEVEEQLQHYEFQNPCWYAGRNIVNRNMRDIRNVLHGFQELAGCRIYLLPHQLHTIHRILDKNPYRFLLADEVGLGKTIEALSVVKIHSCRNSNQKILIVVPDHLVQQWQTEMFLKFDLSEGLDPRKNQITLKSFSQLTSMDQCQRYDVTVVDEVHRYIKSPRDFGKIYRISLNSENFLALSATPVGNKDDIYFNLVKMINPVRYSNLSPDLFSELLGKQNAILEYMTFAVQGLEEYQEVLNECLEDEGHPSEDDEVRDVFEELIEQLSEACELIGDENLEVRLKDLSMEDTDYGIGKLRTLITEITSNYQIESSFIRNRRRILESDEDGICLPERSLTELVYEMDQSLNPEEAVLYDQLLDYIRQMQMASGKDGAEDIAALLAAFFSSAQAFSKIYSGIKARYPGCANETIDAQVREWVREEGILARNIQEIVDDPEAYPSSINSRLYKVAEYLYEREDDGKVLLFATYPETFELYKAILNRLFRDGEVSFFCQSMERMEAEKNIYRFQTDDNCRLLLCDPSGGEGRNLQLADEIVHIDLPWDAAQIEQRIGRLDRLERDALRPDVESVVVYSKGTLEEDLFQIWNKGLNLFRESMSGMEIISHDLKESVYAALEEDLESGLPNEIDKILKMTEGLRKQLKKEQQFDCATIQYQPLFQKMRQEIQYYNTNDSKLFAETMRKWGSLCGFKPSSLKKDVIGYTPSKFSSASANNALFIPPEWHDYEADKKAIFQNRVMKDIFEEEGSLASHQSYNSRSIIGTFSRKTAIENDYIRYFAPGEQLFDSIVSNSLYSSKGQVAAVEMAADFNWEGFVMMWTLNPDLSVLIDHDIPYSNVEFYRQYIPEKILPSIVTIRGDKVPGRQILQKHSELLVDNKTGTHLGQRSKKRVSQTGSIQFLSNIDGFKKDFPPEVWKDLVSSAVKASYKKALASCREKAQLVEVREAFDQVERHENVRSELYKIAALPTKDSENVREYVYESLKSANLNLESCLFLRCRKQEG